MMVSIPGPSFVHSPVGEPSPSMRPLLDQQQLQQQLQLQQQQQEEQQPQQQQQELQQQLHQQLQELLQQHLQLQQQQQQQQDQQLQQQEQQQQQQQPQQQSQQADASPSNLGMSRIASAMPGLTVSTGWPESPESKIFSLFANACATPAQAELTSPYPSPCPATLQQLAQGASSQWATPPSREPSQAAVLAALQSIQLKLQVQEQAVEYQTLEKQNQQLITGLLSAQQRIQELQSEVALLQQCVEKMDAAARYAAEEQRMREQLLHQRHAALTASNMEAEMAIQQMEESLNEVRHHQKELNYSNIMLALGYPAEQAPASPAMAPAVSAASLSVPASPGGPGSVSGSVRSGAASYANRKCYNCGQKGHRAGDCPNPRTRPDTDDADATDADSPATSPVKAPVTPDGAVLAPATPNAPLAGRSGVLPPRCPVSTPGHELSTPVKGYNSGKNSVQATPEKPPRRSTSSDKSSKGGSSSLPGTPAGKGKSVAAPLSDRKPPVMLASLPSPKLGKKNQGFLTPPITPPSSWKAGIGCSPLPPLTPTPVGAGAGYTRAPRPSVARCISWQG